MIGSYRPKAVLKVLIVDDSPEERAELRRMLLLGSDRCYTFTEVETGAACLQVCLENQDNLPDCVILDYHLPDFDAPDLLSALGGPDALCCPILVVTGRAGRINSGAIVSQGAQDFISKSWLNPESLTRSLENSIERYWLNQELSYSHRRFKAYLENSALIAWMKDEKGCYNYLSRNYETRFNVRFADWNGKTDFDVWPKGMAEKFRADDIKVLSSGSPFEIVEEAMNSDGSISWWLTSKFPFKDQGGRAYVGGLAVDITERKQIELALQESQDALRLAAAGDAYWIGLSDALRPLSDPQEIQAKAARVLGEFLRADRVHYGEVIENGAVSLVRSDYCAGVSSVAGRHRLDAYGPLVMAEVRAGRTLVISNVAEDSRLAPAEKKLTAELDIGAYVLAPQVKNLQLVGLLAVHQVKPRVWTAAEIAHIEETADRTWEAVERGHIEKKLRAGEARLQAIVQQASAGLVETDLAGRLILVNDHFCKMVGRSRGELLTLRWQDITYPDDVEANETQFRRCIITGEDFVIEKRYLRPEGGTVWVSNKVCLLREASGQVISVLAVSFDIGERKQNEMRLQEQAELLNEADKRKDEFLALLAHELRNPLAPIRNAVEIQKTANTDPSRISWCTSIIDRQLRHLTGLVDDLLDVSRISRGLIELKKETLEIQDIIKPAVESNQPLLDSRRQIFRMTLPPEPLWVEGDRIRLAQILSNLLNNAAKYTQNQGTIGLSVEPSATKICLRITDNGYGIDQAAMDHLFDLFYQVEPNLEHSQGGLGIGLSLVRTLVEMHGGEIQAFSPGTGKGSEFVIWLPRVRPEDNVAVLPLALTAESQKRRILVVDDNHDVAESLAMLLEIEGHQVSIAHAGPAALEIARAERPEIIVLDIGLPGMNGYAVAQALRKNDALARTLVIAMTGYGQQADREQSRAAGFDEHLVKPVDYEVLRKLLSNYSAD